MDRERTLEKIIWKSFVRIFDLRALPPPPIFLSQEILSQLDSLRLENRRLSETVMKLELGFHEAKEISLADLQENYIEALNKLVSENQQLQKDLMSTKSQLEHATHMCKKKDGRTFNPAHSRTAGFKNADLK